MTTFNRLEISKRTLQSLLNTITGDYYLVIVDNASTDRTREWILDKDHPANLKILNDENLHIGGATNRGWERGLLHYPEADLLMQLDNDFEFSLGWTDKANDYFIKIPKLGQLGLNYEAIEDAPPTEAMKVWYDLESVGRKNNVTYLMESRPIINGKQILTWPGNIGGTSITRREVWDSGIRYMDHQPAPKDKNTPVICEDAVYSYDVLKAGWFFGHATDNLGRHSIAYEDWLKDPEYYRKQYEARGLGLKYEEIMKQLKAQQS